MELDGLFNVADATAGSTAFQQFADIFEQLASIPEESLTENTIELVTNMVKGGLTSPNLREESVQAFLDGLRESGTSHKEAQLSIDGLKDELKNAIDALNPSPLRRQLMESVLNEITNLFDEAIARYHTADIKLPVTLEDGAIIPTYAHPTDAAADLYANEDVILPAHSRGTMVNTGVRIGLPEGWAAYIVPRSSTGFKTPLRQSNSFGVIDSHYRGPLKLLFDNISDEPYEIHKGDKLSQMFIMPVYHFAAEQVSQLDETDRGEGGFGSTGAH